ncbi:glycosyl hydrolase family 85-domain-containing protein, partial [Paraphoma chrysanthemicola]
MASILGWKDILRPIRDGYRHMFPSPDTGPTPEERQKRREQDRKRGFTYFDTFRQLETWNVNESDPLQKANTPLLRRSRAIDSQDEPRARVLLCHDMSGNYHDYESMHEVGVAKEMYACDYLQYIDTLVYFSHKLVCVPPPAWTNTLHRNGVKALGTLIIEPQAQNTEKLLQHTGEGPTADFRFAIILANIAKHYGFDGWLVNIEKPFVKETWHANNLEAFLSQLRTELGVGRQLVSYQNGVTPANLPFAEACGGILTNYNWDLRQAEEAKQFIAQSSISFENVYFGIDVWAQNRSGFGIPRTTHGKGGTTTGVAVAKLADIGLSAGIFAPAWSFEHFEGHGKDVDRTMWEGDNLPDGLECSCGRAISRHQPIEGFSIVRHAKAFPAGTASTFYTDFTRAFGRHGSEEERIVFNGQPLHAQVGAHSILPLPMPEVVGATPYLRHRLEDCPGETKLVIDVHHVRNADDAVTEHHNCWVPLYKLDMPADGTRRIVVTCRNVAAGLSAKTSFYLKFSEIDGRPPQNLQLLSIDKSGEICTITAQIEVPARVDTSVEDVRLDELGFLLHGYNGTGSAPIVEVFSISVVPVDFLRLSTAPTIDNIRIESRGQGENEHMRLCWDYVAGRAARHVEMPHSEITGPFSHFTLRIDGLQVGRAHALEYVLNQNLAKDLASKDVAVDVTGVGFDGRKLANTTTTLRI